MEDIHLQEKLAQYEKKINALELKVHELTDFVENAPIPLHWVDGNGIIIWANQAELDKLGYTKEEYIGFPIGNFHADQEVIADILDRLTKNETLYNYPAKLKCKDGRLVHVLINSNVLRKDGEFIHTRCFTRDITDIIKEEDRKADVLTQLELSETRLRMAIESTHLGTWEWNPITGALYWSEECKNIYGLLPEDHISFGDFAKHIYPQDAERVQAHIDKAIDPTGNGTYDITYRITRFDNQAIRWIRVQGKVYFNEANQAEKFIGTVLDYTDSKQTQENILKSEKLFRSIALNIPKSLIIVIDKEHRFVIIEGDIMEKMGYNSANYAGKHPTEIAPPEQYEESKHLYERVIAGEKFSIERKAATGEDYMVHFVPLKNENDEVESGLIIALDITDIKKAERESAKLAAIIESSDDAIISKTLEGIITSWNESAERTFGYAAEEMIGQPILKLIPPDRQDEEPQILSRLRKGERVEHFETRRTKKDGNLIDVSLTISPIKDLQGNIIGLSKIARDITDKKQEEQRKNDFVAVVSHELKTPLTSIIGYVQLLLARAKKEENEFSANVLGKTEIQARKMSLMIQDFLNLARMEEGKLNLHKEVFSLPVLIDEIIADPQFSSPKHTIKIANSFDTKVNVDRDKIGQVLINLLNNAIKYSPAGGAITISCEQLEGKIKITVKDEGIGIGLADQKRLFDRFYRVNNDRLKSVSGFGLGLYLVSEILRYHNSNIYVESKEGQGSTFYFSLDMV